MPPSVADHPLRRALPLFLFAGFCFASLDATAKFLVREHSLFLVVWARYAGQMLVVTPWAWHRAGPGFWRTRRLALQLVRSACLVAATLCFFGGLRYLPLAEGSAITFLAPVLIVLLSRPLLDERPTRARWIAAIVGFLGILIIVRPGSAVFHPAVVLLIGAALCNALYQLLTRKLLGEDPRTMLFYSALVGTAALSCALPWAMTGATMSSRETMLFLALGLFAGLGHWAMIDAFTRAPAALLAPFTYLQILWSTGYGWLVFRQIPDALSGLGMAVIVASGLGLAAQERRRAHRG